MLPRSFAEVAAEHRAADEACGRQWTCCCAACRAERSAERGATPAVRLITINSEGYLFQAADGARYYRDEPETDAEKTATRAYRQRHGRLANRTPAVA